MIDGSDVLQNGRKFGIIIRNVFCDAFRIIRMVNFEKPARAERRKYMYDLNKRPEDMARITTIEQANAFIDEQVAAVRAQVGDKKVLLALSGGVDSSVVAALLIKAKVHKLM